MHKYNVSGTMHNCIERTNFLIKICVNKIRPILFFLLFYFYDAKYGNLQSCSHGNIKPPVTDRLRIPVFRTARRRQLLGMRRYKYSPDRNASHPHTQVHRSSP